MSDTRTKLTSEQITLLYQRGFGSETNLEFVQELGGGTVNETYLLEHAGKNKIILRIAPLPTNDIEWDDVALMRREHSIRPFFASIVPLMPRIILSDFTHQIIERDYVFQTFIEGERWSDIEGDFTPEENIDLWRQCGEIVKRIHCTTGQEFGHPYPGQRFTKWSETILNRFSRIARSMLDNQLDTSAFSSIMDVVSANTLLFDEIKISHLLHGDLWTFNLLVTRRGKKSTIVGVLDADRAWWGDPLADWIMFLLNIRQQEPEWQQPLSAFFDGYGKPDHCAAAQFRQESYIAMHIGTSAVGSARDGNEEDIARAYRDLDQISRSLPALLA